MRLACLYLDDVVVVPGAKDNGAGLPRSDLRESSFHEAEGWDIYKVAPNEFTLWREGMPKTVHVEGYARTYTMSELPEGITPVTFVDRDELAAQYPKRKGKR